MTPEVYVHQFKTRWGVFRVAATKRGVSRIWFPNQFPKTSAKEKIPLQTQDHLRACERWMREFFAERGGPPASSRLAIDWKDISRFDRRVLKTLARLPAGSVTTYQRLASASGVPRAARAVGGTLKRNPFPVLFPCHRVVRADHTIGGFQSGVVWKERLLDLERQRKSKIEKGRSFS